MKATSCRTVKKHLVPLCEKTLPPDLLKEIRIHLSECPRCEKLVRNFSELWSDLAPQREPEFPGTLWPALERVLKDRREKSHRPARFTQKIPGLLRPAAAALGLVFAIWTGWELGSHPHDAGKDSRLSTPGQKGSEEMYISEYMAPFKDVLVGSVADFYLDSDTPNEGTTP